MPDPIIAAARELISDAFDVLRRACDGMSDDALDWEPAGPETNSIAVLTIHGLNSTRTLLSIALDLPRPERDRAGEFGATGYSSADLTALIDDLGGRILTMLDGAPDQIDWSTPRRWIRGDGNETTRTAAWLMVHSVDHLRGHADEASLTRHMWMARS